MRNTSDSHCGFTNRLTFHYCSASPDESHRFPWKDAAFLIAIEDLIAGLAGNPKLPAKFRHRLAGEPASHKLHSFIHDRTLPPWHNSLPVGRKVLPMCPVRCVTHVSDRSQLFTGVSRCCRWSIWLQLELPYDLFPWDFACVHAEPPQ